MKLSDRILAAAVGLAILAVAACTESQSSANPPAAPPPAVSIVQVKAEPVPIVSDLPGRIAPTRIAEVRPRVTGIVVKRVFEQGSLVKEGDVLYQIDPAPFRVQVESAQATQQRALAAQNLARQQADRQKELRQRNISSAQDLDTALAQLAQADADVAAARAGLDAAKLNLQYSDVRAPISGRIGRALITEGALVNANGTENLATIQQLDPVYADFTQPSAQMRQLRKALKDGLLKGPAEGQATVKLLFDDGSEYPRPGRLLFSESTVDETTGQITMRAEFPNPDGDLLPGMYVRVLIEQAVDQAALTVPEQAVQRDSSGKALLYVVGEDNVAQMRPVTVGRTTGQQVVITGGLKSGERVVVEGFQKIHPGAKVEPADWKPAADTLSRTQSKADAG
ncbi:MAG: efflux transporter periplasmic adaptor subunit [Rhizobiales bacterium 65-79]|jgi:membrane fusion protein (multidrug efflux system)|nr:efflux RND transporter periplasmic adaptor subunit [Hyphomicrobiales bacterium]OJU05630.1 MAG: efflux transporter periplasmic adaptor subunit [Rhizobiales bacterium 65-79]